MSPSFGAHRGAAAQPPAVAGRLGSEGRNRSTARGMLGRAEALEEAAAEQAEAGMAGQTVAMSPPPGPGAPPPSVV